MNSKITCRVCQKPIPADAPQGVCPACLFRLADSRRQSKADAATSEHRSKAAPAPALSEVVEAFPQLEIGELLGCGGMGAVYRVRQKALDRVAALKLLNPKLADDATFQERFTREARLMARLIHPNIALIFEFGQAGKFFYLLMEYVDGVSLRAAIRQRSINAEEALRIVPQVCDALQYAHDNGVIHRDIKPENILLDRFGRVKLVDFGLAKIVDAVDGQPTLTGTQQVMGTMNYMAPEQWERPSEIDHRADIFSLGVVFYELLTGELPLGRFAPPSERVSVDHRLDPVVLRTLEKDPASRFQTANEFKTAVSSACVEPAAATALPATAPPPNVAAGSDAMIVSVPYSVGDNVEHWETQGLAILFPDRLRLEYKKLSDWLGTNKGIQAAEVPLSEIANVRLRNGPISRGIEIQTKSLMSLKDFPYSDDGVAFLKTKSEDRSRRDHMFAELCRVTGQQAPNIYDLVRETEDAKARLHGPSVWMFFASLANAMIALAAGVLIGLIVYMVVGKTTMPVVNAVVPQDGNDVPRGVLWQSISLAGIGVVHFFFACFLLISALRMRQMRSYGFCISGCILAMIPIHVGFLVGLPGGIWGLGVLGRHSVFSAFERRAQEEIERPAKPKV